MHQLHTAIASGDAAIIREMLQAGAAVDQRDEFGNTPLHRASWQGDISIVEALLSFDAQADARRKDGKTPLDLVELRARGAGNNPPKGLAEETFLRDFRDLSALLREKTPGCDMVLQCNFKPCDSGNVRLVCTNFVGAEVASVTFDPESETLAMTQEVLAQQLEISQARLRLVMPDARLPTEAENVAPLSVLCSGVRAAKIEVLSTERTPPSDKEWNRVLNELSWASVSTSASESELNNLFMI